MTASLGTPSWLTSENSLFEVSFDSGATWDEVPGYVSYGEQGGARSVRDVAAAGQDKVSKVVGQRHVQSVNVELIAIPQHPTYDKIRDAYIDGSPLQFRLTTHEEELYAGAATISISAQGVVSFTAGNNATAPTVDGNDIGQGVVFKVGSGAQAKGYVVSKIEKGSGANAAPVIMVAPPTAAVTSQAFKAVRPQMRRGPFTAKVVDIDTGNLSVGGELTSTLMVQPRTSLPKWAIAA